MGKAVGIIALILGIIAISPLNVLLVGVLPFWIMIWWLIPLLAVILGIVGTATSKGGSRAPGIIGIVFGAIGFVMYIVWLIIFSLLGFLGVLGMATLEGIFS